MSIIYKNDWETSQIYHLNGEILRGDIALYQLEALVRNESPGFGEFKLRTFCPYADFLVHAIGEHRIQIGDMRHFLRIERNGDLRVNFESFSKVEQDKHDITARLFLFGLEPVELTSISEGYVFSKEFVHDGKLSYGAKKLVFGGKWKYNREPGGGATTLKGNAYLGTLENMFKQFLDFRREQRVIEMNGMTELGDDMFHVNVKMNLAMESLKFSTLIQGPRSSTQFGVGKISQPDGVELFLNHHCPNVEIQVYGKGGFTKFRSDLVGKFGYRKAADQQMKLIDFHLGHKADISQGLDLGISSGIKINEKEWLLNSNMTFIPGRMALSFGIANAEAFRHIATIVVGRRWDKPNRLEVDCVFEFDSSAVSMEKIKFALSNNLVWNNNNGKIGMIDASLIVVKGDREMDLSLLVDAKDPKKAMVIEIKCDTPFFNRTEIKIQYSADMPFIVISGNFLYGQYSGRLRGLFEVNQYNRNGLDLAYSVAFYSGADQHAEASVRGQIMATSEKGEGFITVEVQESPYAINVSKVISTFMN